MNSRKHNSIKKTYETIENNLNSHTSVEFYFDSHKKETINIECLLVITNNVENRLIRTRKLSKY